MWVTWVNCKLIEDMMVFNHVVKFHENRMKNGGDTYTTLNTQNGAKIHTKITKTEKICGSHG